MFTHLSGPDSRRIWGPREGVPLARRPAGVPGGWLLGPKDGTPNARGLARGMPPVWDSGALESTLGGSVQVGWRRSDGQQADRPENADPLMTRAP